LAASAFGNIRWYRHCRPPYLGSEAKFLLFGK